MRVKEFVDLKVLEHIIADWSTITGLDASITELDGEVVVSSGKGDSEKVVFSKNVSLNRSDIAVVTATKITDDEIVSEVVEASSRILIDILDNFVLGEYNKQFENSIADRLNEGVEKCTSLVKEIQEKTTQLKKIQGRQKILALNASIEAARAGDLGRGFAVVATEVGKLSESSSQVNKEIEDVVANISQVVAMMNSDK